MMNYDPNLTNSGRMAKQTVRLTFGVWDYRKMFEVEVGGNCTGLTVIDAAVGKVLQELPVTTRWGDGEVSILLLEKTADGEVEELEVEDEELQYDEWLKDMLIAAEIVAIRAD